MHHSSRVLFAAAIIWCSAVAAMAADTVRVTAERADIVAEPSAGARVLATVSKGTVLEVLRREGVWIRVSTPGTGAGGYLPALFLEAAYASPSTSTAAPARPVAAPTPATASVPSPTQPNPAPVPQPSYTPPPTATASSPAVGSTPGDKHQRKGFWIGFGLGYGSAAASADCEDCSGDRDGSFSGYVTLGGTLNPQVLLGVESNAWVKDVEGVTLTLGSLTGTATFYPVVSGGMFLKAGVGLSYISTDVYAGNVNVSVSKTGWGLLAGLGYDLRVGRNISITPSVNYWYGKPGDLEAGIYVLPGWSQNVVDFSLGITFH